MIPQELLKLVLEFRNESSITKVMMDLLYYELAQLCQPNPMVGMEVPMIAMMIHLRHCS